MMAKSGLLIRELGDELLVLDPERDQVYQFNATASLIWQLAEAGLAAEEIATRLATEFEVAHATVESDVKSTLAEFCGRGLFKASDSGA